MGRPPAISIHDSRACNTRERNIRYRVAVTRNIFFHDDDDDRPMGCSRVRFFLRLSHDRKIACYYCITSLSLSFITTYIIVAAVEPFHSKPYFATADTGATTPRVIHNKHNTYSVILCVYIYIVAEYVCESAYASGKPDLILKTGI